MNGLHRLRHVLDVARDIVASYDTLVTLRQLLYRPCDLANNLGPAVKRY